MNFLAWLEQTAVSVWVREEPTLWAFPFVLFLHTLGLGVVAGLSVVLNVWVLTLAERYPMAPMERFFPLIWLGFTLALASGLLLLAAYPTKALTDPVFYAKIAMIVVALVQLQRLRKHVFDDSDPRRPLERNGGLRLSAGVALGMWFGAIVTGRLLAYTYRHLTAADLLAGY